MDTFTRALENHLNEVLLLERFKNITELKKLIKENIDGMKVIRSCKKSYYDDDFQDYEYIIELSYLNKGYDLTVYYAKSRIKECVITEIALERM